MDAKELNEQALKLILSYKEGDSYREDTDLLLVENVEMTDAADFKFKVAVAALYKFVVEEARP